MGLLNLDEQKYGYNWHKYKLLVYFYKKEIIEPEITVTSQEIAAYYRQQKHQFVTPESALFYIIKFTSRQEALMYLNIIQKQGLQFALEMIENKKIGGVKGVLKDKMLSFDRLEIERPAINSLKRMAKSEAEVVDFCIYIKLENNVNRDQELDEVAERIRSILHGNKVQQMMENEIHHRLKNKFRLESKTTLEEMIDKKLRKITL